jgi:hypothetical protein
MTSEIEEETSSEEVVETVESVESDIQPIVFADPENENQTTTLEETVEQVEEPEPEPSRYLVLDSNNSVVNIIVYNGVSEYNPGEGLSLEPNPVDENKNYIFTTIGSIKNEDGTFTHPEPNVVTE